MKDRCANNVLKRWHSNLTWYKRTIRGRRPKFQIRGGDIGEEIVVDFCKRELQDAEQIFQSIRIPDPDTFQSKGEIDVIICTLKATYFLEVKHWKGRVQINENNEFTTKKIKNKPILSELERKTNSAKRMFLSRYGESLGDVYPLVVFSHTDCNLSDRLRSMSNIVKLKHLTRKIGELEKGISDNITETSRKKRKKMFDDFGTWDKVGFEDDSYIIGDIRNQSHHINRKKFHSLTTTLDYGLLSTIFRGPRLNIIYQLRDGSTHSEKLIPNIEIEINIPWERKIRSIPLEEITVLEFGYENNIDWLDEQRRGNKKKNQKRYRNKKVNFQMLKKEYKIGQKLIATVIKHIPDREDPDAVAGLLVSIVENQVKGLVPKGELPFQQFIPIFFAVGKEVPVEVISITKKGLRLKIPE